MNILRFLLPLAVLSALTSCQQQNQKYTVYWFEEADGAEAGASFSMKYRNRYYVRQPLFSIKHFDRFKSFMNMQDGSYGVGLFLKKEYRNRLYYSTVNKSGKFLLPVVDGMAFAPTSLDVPITNGCLVIWGGLNGYDLKMLSESLEPVDKEMEEKRYLSKDPRPPRAKPKDLQQERDASGRTIPEIF